MMPKNLLRLRAKFISEIDMVSKTPQSIGFEQYLKKLSKICLEYQSKFFEVTKAENDIKLVLSVINSFSELMKLTDILDFTDYSEFYTWASDNDFLTDTLHTGDIIIADKLYPILSVDFFKKCFTTIEDGQVVTKKYSFFSRIRWKKKGIVNMGNIYIEYLKQMSGYGR